MSRYFSNSQIAVLAVAGFQSLSALSLFIFVACVAAYVRGTQPSTCPISAAPVGGWQRFCSWSVRKLKAQDGKNILLDGSSVLVHTLIETTWWTNTPCTSIRWCWAVARSYSRLGCATT